MKKVTNENRFSVRYPDLINQWHPTKNGDLTPDKFSFGSDKKVWWICQKGHEWEASINKRSNGRSCPYCLGKKVNIENCLKTTNPELVEQWNYNKNIKITPFDVSRGSNKKVWWICEKGHEWEAMISNRATKGRGCPYCSEKRRTSFPEWAVYYYLKMNFKDAVKSYIIPKTQFELDVYIPSLDLAIEYDGEHFHKKIDRDIRKDYSLKEKMPKTKLIRIREPRCPDYQSRTKNSYFSN